MKAILVAGARPNFMKIAPLRRELAKRAGVECRLVHTGQHYDEAMSRVFFEDLGIPEPEVNLEVGSGSHAQQSGDIMKRFEPVLCDYRPDVVIVVGDVNSTIACGLVAVKMGIRLAHVEAGLRSFDRTMPEEINRVLTDAISDFLFCSEESGARDLRREGVSENRIFLVGNVMIDTLLRHRERAEQSRILEALGLRPGTYAVLTLHRPGNVDSDDALAGIVDALEVIQRDLPLVFPAHPRTRKNLLRSTLAPRLAGLTNLKILDPVGYLDFVKLMSAARFVLTDSGGVQEETTALGIPCLTLRENTERPVTVECGTNRLVGRRAAAIEEAYRRIMQAPDAQGRMPPLWDGQAAVRIVDILVRAAW